MREIHTLEMLNFSKVTLAHSCLFDRSHPVVQ